MSGRRPGGNRPGGDNTGRGGNREGSNRGGSNRGGSNRGGGNPGGGGSSRGNKNQGRKDESRREDQTHPRGTSRGGYTPRGGQGSFQSTFSRLPPPDNGQPERSQRSERNNQAIGQHSSGSDRNFNQPGRRRGKDNTFRSAPSGSGSASNPSGDDKSKVFSGGQSQLDTTVKGKEDGFFSAKSMELVTAQMSKASIESSAKFPLRPAFARGGKPTKVWANYFRLDAKEVALSAYTLEVKQVTAPGDNQGASKSSKPSKSKKSKAPAAPGEPGAESPREPREVKGRKLALVIRELVRELSGSSKGLALASDYKQKLISLTELDLKSNPMEVKMASAASGGDVVDTFLITLKGPIQIPLQGLLRYLNNMSDNVGDGSFPRYPEQVDALNVILGNSARSDMENISTVGGSRVFRTNDNSGDLIEMFQDGRVLTAARGFFQSVRMGTGRLLVNVNVTHGVFKAGGPLATICDRLEVRAQTLPQTGPQTEPQTGPQTRANFNSSKIRAFATHLQKTRVWNNITYSNSGTIRKVKTIQHVVDRRTSRKWSGDNRPRITQGIDYPGPRDVSFSKNGRYVTVAQHFLEEYNMQLADYPLFNLGSDTKPSFFPAEVLEVQPGQAVKAKLTGNETTAMLNFACRPPFTNATSIQNDSKNGLAHNDEQLARFGITVGKCLITVDARELFAPLIKYNPSTQERPLPARWGSWNMIDCRVVRPGNRINKWAYVNITRARPVERHVVQGFGRMMSQSGLNVVETPIQLKDITLQDASFGNGLDRTFKTCRQENIEFLLIILPARDGGSLYAKIKTLGDIEYGIHTSCVTSKPFSKGGSVHANIALKWNLKAGGTNHQLDGKSKLLKEGKTMIVGYDVTHPTNMNFGKKEQKDKHLGAKDPADSKASKEPPSVVGLVASTGADCGQWPCRAWEQTSRKEMLGDDLMEAFESRLDLWQKQPSNNGQLPANIVIYRDGVSEGQFAQVLDTELPFIRKACANVYRGREQPSITLVVSVKRHQTRFYPTNKDHMSRSGNIKNGTVVDRGVTQVRYWDFFLTAHDALKGTARPAHYTVLLDEIFVAKYQRAAADELETLTHELCYLFGRATKAVSICPPAYYADIVCERARAHRPAYNEFLDDAATNVSGQTGASAGSAGSPQIHPNLRDTMYYI